MVNLFNIAEINFPVLIKDASLTVKTSNDFENRFEEILVVLFMIVK